MTSTELRLKANATQMAEEAEKKAGEADEESELVIAMTPMGGAGDWRSELMVNSCYYGLSINY